jgi:hypothetical protein
MESGYRANYIILILILFLTFLEALKKICTASQLYDFQTSIYPTILYGMCLTRRAVDMAGIKKSIAIFDRHRYRSLLRVLFMDPELSSTRRTDWSFGDKRYVFPRPFIARPTTERNEDGLSHNMEEVTRVVHLNRTRTKLLWSIFILWNTTLSVWIWNIGYGTFHMNYLVL